MAEYLAGKKGQYMIRLIVLSLYEILILGITVLIAAMVLDLINRSVGGCILRQFGNAAYLAATALSTGLHELSHAIMCIIFLHRIESMALFSLDPTTGRSGYVRHTWRTGSSYQKVGNFFIGIAPMITGVPLLLLLGAKCGVRLDVTRGVQVALSGGSTHWTGPAVARHVIGPLLGGFTGLFTRDNFANPYFYLYLPAALVISRAMAPSLQDLRGSGMGAAALTVFVVLANAVALFFWRDLSGLAAVITACSSALLRVVGSATALSLFALCLLWVIGLIARRRR
jgi:hypothetical protein